MKIGVCLPHYGAAMEAHRMREFAQRVESLGFDSIWVTDHVIIPKALTIVYRERMLDPLAALSYLAGVTDRLILGTSVIILPYRNPITVAKEVASIDALSGGRVILGVASGWMEGEFRALNADFKNRGAVSDEHLRVIRELWTNLEPEFHSEHFHLSDVVFSPQPVQRPHPPIWVGGRSRRAVRRAVELGDGWHPNGLGYDDLKEAVAYMNDLSRRAGRSAPPELSTRGSVEFDERSGAFLWGSGEAMTEAINRYEGLGMTHIAVSFADAPMNQVLEDLDRFAADVLPAVR